MDIQRNHFYFQHFTKNGNKVGTIYKAESLTKGAHTEVCGVLASDIYTNNGLFVCTFST